MKVLYLTALENTVKNDIHKNQVLSLGKSNIDYTFLFISPKFILNRSGFTLNKNHYSDKKIIETKIPIFSFNFCLHVLIIPYYLIISSYPYLKTIYKTKPQIVHCRNMLSTLLAVFCKKLLKLKYKIVCDPRSVYVEECVIQKHFSYNGINYKLWKKIEKFLYKNSNSCIGLSEQFKEYLREFNKNSVFIPAVVNDRAIFDNKKRLELRKEFGLTIKDRVFCYIGSIGTWHSVKKLESYLDNIIENIDVSLTPKILFLSGNVKITDRLNKKYAKYILYCGRVKPEKVIDYLLISDYGLLPGSDQIGSYYDLLYRTMISSKAEEYLVAGLPIIVNPRITSVANLVKQNDAGLVMLNSLVDKTFNRENISKIGLSLFSLKSVTLKFQKLYNSLLLV